MPRLASVAVVAAIAALMPTALVGATDYCATDGSDYEYSETLNTYWRKITYNGCPNHRHTNAIGDNPNKAVKSSMTFRVPRYPMYDEDQQVDLSSQGGAIGVTRAGTQIYSPYGGPTYGTVTKYSKSAPYIEGDTFDECGAHSSTSSSVSYHHHIPPSCLLQQLNQTDSAHSPQVGWAADGFPVYGPRGPNGVMMQTCTETGGTYGTDVCTDDCTGYWSTLIGDGYNYRYYILGTYQISTGDCDAPISDGEQSSAYYPFTNVCMNGCVPTDATGSPSLSALNDCSGSAVDGYTSVTGELSALDQNTEACSGNIDEDNDDSGGTGIALPMPVVMGIVMAGIMVGGAVCYRVSGGTKSRTPPIDKHAPSINSQPEVGVTVEMA